MRRKCVEVLGQAKKKTGTVRKKIRVWIKNKAWWWALGLNFGWRGVLGNVGTFCSAGRKKRARNLWFKRADRFEMRTSDDAPEK